MDDLADFAAPPVGALPGSDLLAALPLSLAYVPGSPEAVALADRLVTLVAPLVDVGRGNQRGATGMGKLRAAVFAIAAGVIRRWGSGAGPHLAFRSLDKAGFTGSPVGYRTFAPAVAAMVKLGLLGRYEGIAYSSSDWNGGTSFERRASRFWPRPALLALASECGVRRDRLRDHLRFLPPTAAPVVGPVVVLRALADRPGSRAKAADIPIPRDDAAAARIAAEVDAHNDFAASIRVEGCAPPRWRRVFRGDWFFGGRWIAAGNDGVYQQMNEAERLGLTIGGGPVAEVDATACHLTILCGLARAAMPPGDPYALSDAPRHVAKAWVTATLGKGSPVQRWSRRSPEDVRTYDPAAVAAALIARFPALAAPAAVVPPRLAQRFALPGEKHAARRLLTHYLMGIEAEALTLAMASLRARGVLALPVHDSLVVPRAATALAVDAMREAFGTVTGIAPTLDVQGAGGRGEATA